MGQRTGILLQKGYLPADFLAGGSLKLPYIEESQGNGWQAPMDSRSLVGGVDVWSNSNDALRSVRTRNENSQMKKIHMTLPSQGQDNQSIGSNQMVFVKQDDFHLSGQKN
jgi:hypothetical protein